MPKVTLQPSGKQFDVAADESVLDAARRRHIMLPYGCRTGSCATCRGRVLSGSLSYPDGLPPGLTRRDAERGYGLLCIGRPVGDTVIEAQEIVSAGELTVKTLPARVEHHEALGHDVMGVWLKLPAVERMQFLAGQYLDVLLKDGHRRSFSIASAPHKDDLIELHIRHVPGGQFTSKVFDALKPRALWRVQGPLGGFYLHEESPRPALLVGGGTGFAPLKAMLEHAEHIGLDRPLHLYWGARAARDLYLHDLAEDWARRLPNVSYTPVLSEPRAEDRWTGRTGWVHEAVLADWPALGEVDVYMSGPPPMIDAGSAAFFAAGLPRERLYSDAFEYAPETRAKIGD